MCDQDTENQRLVHKEIQYAQDSVSKKRHTEGARQNYSASLFIIINNILKEATNIDQCLFTLFIKVCFGKLYVCFKFKYYIL